MAGFRNLSTHLRDLIAWRSFGLFLFCAILPAVTSHLAAEAPQDTRQSWITRGFEGFREGTFGNAGQNIYVSKRGILQRIHQFDLDQDGYLDVLFCNSQDHWERPDAYIYSDVLGKPDRRTIPSDGAESGVVFDLNGDGYDDLVLAMGNNGMRPDLNAFVYYGDPDGLSEKRMIRLPAPAARSVTAGDFNGDRLPDLAFALDSGLRLFYHSPLGFESKRFVDLDLPTHQLAAGDLDEDGFMDLISRDRQGRVSVCWGSPSGLDIGGRQEVVVDSDSSKVNTASGEAREEGVPLAAHVTVGENTYLVVPRSNRLFLVPTEKKRSFRDPVVFDVAGVLATATGDINGNGLPELVAVTTLDQSWVFWDLDASLRPRRRTSVRTTSACDVAVADLDGDGKDEVIVCQSRTRDSYTFHSLVFKGGDAGLAASPIQLETLNARRVLVGRTSGKGPELVFVNRSARRVGGDVNIYLYHGCEDGFKPERRTELAARGAVGGIAGDFNDDGITDLLVANCSENDLGLDPGSFVFFGKADGFSFEPSVRLPTQRAHGLAVADINRDGFLDFVLVGFSNPDLLVFYGSDQGYSSEHSARLRMEFDGEVYDEPRWIHLADFNRDGWLDLVVPQIAFDRSFLLWGGPEGFSLGRRQMLAVWHGSYANSADLDGNGWLDLVIGGHTPSRGVPHDSFVYVYWNGPDGLREDRRTLLPANGVNAVGIRDLNNDGWLDMVVSNYHDNRFRDIDSYIYWGSAKGFSASRMLRLPAHSASGSILNDFNEDGWIDIAIAHHKIEGDHVGFSAIWWNGPQGFSQTRRTKLPTMGPHGAIVIDPGNQLDRKDEEFYESKPFHVPDGRRVAGITVKAEIPAKTWVRAELRLAATVEGLDRATWQPVEAVLTHKPEKAAWVQYRLALGTKGSGRTPRVSEVIVKFASTDDNLDHKE